MRLIFATLFALAGCANPLPGIETQIVRVPQIRVEKCIATVDIPALPAALPTRPANTSAALDLAMAKALELQSAAEKMRALLVGCAG